MNKEPFESLLQTLLQTDPPRVWSLLVTVFGDLAQSEDSFVSSSVLNAIAAQVGLKPEATRVALHRLRKDGWIDARRNGRRSSYHLTPWGRGQSAKASPIIYAAGPKTGPAWMLLRNAVSDTEASLGAVWINSTVGLATTNSGRDDILAMKIAPRQHIPGWISAKLCSETLLSATDGFCAALNKVRPNLQPGVSLTPMQVATLRVLIVHEWRRIVLRVPDLPDHVFPADWKGPDCRARVAELLDRLPRPSMETLNKEASIRDAA